MTYKSSIPEGSSGIWRVEKFTVNEAGAALTALQHIGGRYVPPGSYTRLMRKGAWSPIMSDTPAEIRDLRPLLRKAQYRILINGLGLGIAAEMCLLKPEVKFLTVVEISQDVINLVGPYFESTYGDRIEIIHADSFEYKPPRGVRYQAVWHDIWDNICTDNLPEMHRLHRKYGRRTDWQGSWCRHICETRRRHDTSF